MGGSPPTHTHKHFSSKQIQNYFLGLLLQQSDKRKGGPSCHSLIFWPTIPAWRGLLTTCLPFSLSRNTVLWTQSSGRCRSPGTLVSRDRQTASISRACHRQLTTAAFLLRILAHRCLYGNSRLVGQKKKKLSLEAPG